MRRRINSPSLNWHLSHNIIECEPSDSSCRRTVGFNARPVQLNGHDEAIRSGTNDAVSQREVKGETRTRCGGHFWFAAEEEGKKGETLKLRESLSAIYLSFIE
jgi:hypothetical protein